MRSAGARIKHPKRRGEWAEMCFALRAMEEGLVVSKPWGEMAHYDCIVEYHWHCARVQVKSTIFKDRGGYSCSMRGSQGPYKSNAFDFVAVYVIPIEVWYIVPEKLVRGQGSIAVYPTLKKCKYGAYREAWELLKGRGAVAGKIEFLTFWGVRRRVCSSVETRAEMPAHTSRAAWGRDTVENYCTYFRRRQSTRVLETVECHLPVLCSFPHA